MVERYLIVQLADRGDLILSTPAIAALRDSKPDAYIALLVAAHTASLVQDIDLVDEIMTFDRQHFNSSRAFLNPANLRRLFSIGQYDTVIFFHHFTIKPGTLKFWLIALACGAKRRIGLQNGNGWFLTDSIPDGGFGARHQAQYWLDLVSLVGGESTQRPAKIKIQPYALSTLEVTRISSSKKSIVIHAGGGNYSLARRWDASKFAAVADQLHETFDAAIILVGGLDDDGQSVKSMMQTEPIDLTGRTSLSELAGIIQQADLYVGTDSGVTHIAAAVGTPIISIFGPSNADAWGPWTPHSQSLVVRSAPECSPCSYVGHEIGLRDGCSARTCMRMVTSSMVIDAARQILEDKVIENRQVNQSVHQRKTIQILGLPVDVITYEQWLNLIDEWVRDGDRCHHVCTINPEFVMIAQKDVNFRNILKRADLCVPDGIGLLLASRWLKTPLPERVTGSDGVPRIAERAAKKQWKLFFLGAAEGVAAQAADVLCNQYPDLQIVGIYSGTPSAQEEDHIVQMVNESGADILFVAYGAPQQDKWIARNSPRLQVKMAMGVGGSFDFIAGIVPRAPLWMRNSGLEWLYRLYLQPSRIGRMMRLPQFVMAVLLRGAN